MHLTHKEGSPVSILHVKSSCKAPLDFSSVYSQPQSDKNSVISSRARKSSAHDFCLEVQQFEERHSHHGRRLKTLEALETLERGQMNAQQLEEKDVFLKSKLHDELETHYHGLEKETEPLQKEEAEELDYVTFRMVKQNEKTHLKSLRDRMLPNKSGKESQRH
jgi:hypothetical protein